MATQLQPKKRGLDTDKLTEWIIKECITDDDALDVQDVTNILDQFNSDYHDEACGVCLTFDAMCNVSDPHGSEATVLVMYYSKAIMRPIVLETSFKVYEATSVRKLVELINDQVCSAQDIEERLQAVKPVLN